MKQVSSLTKRIAAVLLAASMVFLSACGCQKDGEPASSSSGPSSSDISGSSEPEPEPIHREPVKPPADKLEKLNEKIAINEDVVAWLTVPNTEVDEHVLLGMGADPADNYDVKKEGEFYERRNINKEYDWYGSYFADYESKLGDRNEMSNVLTIYGHSMNDDKDSDKFSKLKRYRDIEFAQENPYMYLTTPDDDMVFKIFAILDTDWHYVPYFYPNKSGKELQALIDEMKARSMYDYDVEVDSTDKLLVLSTCTYLYGSTQAEQEKYRFLVVGRLVRPDEKTDDKTITLKVNEDMKKPTEK